MTEAPPRNDAALASPLPAPPDGFADDVVWQQLVEYFDKYDRSAARHRLAYQALKIVTLVLGGVVTVLAAANSPHVLTAALAAGAVAAEGISQLFQLHTNWVNYRATAESLRTQAFMFVAGLRPYDDPEKRRTLLAKTIQTVVAKENTSWMQSMQSPQG